MENARPDNWLTIVFTTLATLMPVLCAYPSFIQQVELGTFLAMIMFIVIVLKQKGVLYYCLGPIQKKWLLFLGVTAVCTIISITLMNYESEEISVISFRYLKILVAVFIFFVFGFRYFDRKIGSAVARYFGLINTLLIALQTITRNPLVGRISNEAMFRPAGFFYEPSNVASYMVVVLCVILYDETLRHRLLWAGVAIVGIALSTSGTGIVLIPVIMIMYFLMAKRDVNDRKSVINSLLFTAIGIIVLVFGLMLFSKTSIGHATISRFLTSEGLGGSFTGRFESYANILIDRMPTFYKVIGYGFGYRPKDFYFTSYNAILYGDGYVGIALIICILISSFRNGCDLSKTLVVCYLCLFMGAGIFNFGAITYYFSFIIADSYKLKENGGVHCAEPERQN